MTTLLARLRKAGRLCYNFIFTNKTRILTMRVILLSAWYRFKILAVPMAKLEKTFGTSGKESTLEEPIETLRTAHLVGRRVERVCDKTPWESACLVQALVAQRILRKKDIHTTLYLGVRTEDNAMHAHAWLRCGALAVTGGLGRQHAVVSTFYK